MQGHEIEEVGEIGQTGSAAFAQHRPQRQHQIKHHSDARKVFAGKRAAVLIRIDDAPCIGQRVAGQMVIGNQHLDAEAVGLGHAIDAGDAVIYGDNHIGGFLARSELHDLRREAVTVLKTIGHQIINRCIHRAQCTHAHRAGGGAVGIVVGDDQQFFTLGNRIGQQHRHALQIEHRRRRVQALEIGGELLFIDDAARRVNAGTQRMHAALGQRADGFGSGGAGGDGGHECLDRV